MLVTICDPNVTAVIDSVGAQLISLKDTEGKEYIWQRDPKFWGRCSPLLFPIVGNVRDGKTIIEGKTYHIDKHGFCRDMDFTVTAQSGASAAFRIRDTPETKAVYPYSFCLSLKYSIKEGVLSMEYQVANTEDRPICYCLGAHPGFNCPMEEGTEFKDYVLEFETEETAAGMVYDLERSQFDPGRRIPHLKNSRRLPLNRELFRNDAIYFDDLKSKRVALLNSKTGRGIELSFPGFETIAFWTPYPAEAPFVCFEPWNGSAIYATEDDEFIHKNHIQWLKKGETKTYGLTISIR